MQHVVVANRRKPNDTRGMKIAFFVLSGVLSFSLACSDKATTVDAAKVVDATIVDGPRPDGPKIVDAPTVDARMASPTWVAVHNEFKQ